MAPFCESSQHSFVSSYAGCRRCDRQLWAWKSSDILGVPERKTSSSKYIPGSSAAQLRRRYQDSITHSSWENNTEPQAGRRRSTRTSDHRCPPSLDVREWKGHR
ncbi:rCG34308 [Rattus norvegicus]|uniref:RCG34308 n=1 Tax=Rattus norvegicus TaxID=10116 RepID=A6HJU2_RAT|nr:rCG34308 [Rattus norvegicus]